MKKIILLLGMLVFAGSSVQAACNYECVAPYDMNSKLRTVTSAVVGFNSLAELKAESILKKEIFKIASADELKFNVESYSPKDLKNGIFKSMFIKGKNIEINDVHLSALELKTLCDFNYIQSKGDTLVFKEAFPLSFKLTMNESDLNATMKNERYQKIINDLNNIGRNYAAGLKIASTKVAIKNNKFYYILGFDIPFVRDEQRVAIQADLRIKNGKLAYNNSKLVAGNFQIDLQKLDFIMNYLNPLDFSVKVLKNKNAKFYVEDIDFSENIISANGTIVIPKD